MFAFEGARTAAPAPPQSRAAAPPAPARSAGPVPPAWSAIAYRASPAADGGTAAPGGAAAPSATSTAPPQPQSPPPALVSGEVKIEDLGHAFVFPPPDIIKTNPRDDVRSGFTATAQNVKLAAPPDVFLFGLVQNVMMDHYEASYGGCDSMVPIAGPLLDIDKPADPGPFIHEGADNPIVPISTSFLPAAISPRFTDRPSFPVMREVEVNGSKVTLQSARRTMLFRVALVARDLRNGGLAQVAATGMYMLKWEVNVDSQGNRTLKDLDQIGANYPLSAPGLPVALTPPVANDVGQAAYNAEMARIKTGCQKFS